MTARLQKERRTNRPPRKDRNIINRAVAKYLYCEVGLTAQEIAIAMNVTDSMIYVYLDDTPRNPIYNWKLQRNEL